MGLGREGVGRIGRAQRIFRAGNYFDALMMNYKLVKKPIACTPPGVNCNVNCRLGVTMMY